MRSNIPHWFQAFIRDVRSYRPTVRELFSAFVGAGSLAIGGMYVGMMGGPGPAMQALLDKLPKAPSQVSALDQVGPQPTVTVVVTSPPSKRPPTAVTAKPIGATEPTAVTVERSTAKAQRTRASATTRPTSRSTGTSVPTPRRSTVMTYVVDESKLCDLGTIDGIPIAAGIDDSGNAAVLFVRNGGTWRPAVAKDDVHFAALAESTGLPKSGAALLASVPLHATPTWFAVVYRDSVSQVALALQNGNGDSGLFAARNVGGENTYVNPVPFGTGPAGGFVTTTVTLDSALRSLQPA